MDEEHRGGNRVVVFFTLCVTYVGHDLDRRPYYFVIEKGTFMLFIEMEGGWRVVVSSLRFREPARP